jgi:hypothetical protein
MAAFVFELLSGSYTDLRGSGPGIPMHEYRKGDTIETDEELDVKFKNMFRRLSGPTKLPRDHIPSTEESGETTMDQPDLARPAGKKRIKAEPLPAKTPPVLAETGGEEGDEIVEAADEGDAEMGVEDEGLLAENGGEEGTSEIEGEDVTSEFEDVPKNVTVIKAEPGYTIVHKGKPLNAKPLPTDKHVAMHLKRLKAAKPKKK